MELHLQGFLVLIDPIFTSSSLAVLALFVYISDNNAMKERLKLPQYEEHFTSSGFYNVKCTNYGAKEEIDN